VRSDVGDKARVTVKDARVCPICGGGPEGCTFTYHKLIDDRNLTVDDWRDIYQFMRLVYLPFMHRIAQRAYARARGEED
jgi:hypothetical protein